MLKIRAKDKVKVIAGRSKGMVSTVRQVLKNGRVIVDGANMCKKHQKPNPQAGREGGIINIEASLHVSNIAIYNSETQKADRVGFKFDENGNKFRVFKSTNQKIDS